MEMKISVKKSSEITFFFDNQKKDPNTKEGSKLQTKAVFKCNLIKKIVVGPTMKFPLAIQIEIETEKLPLFSKQSRSNATVKKPKWNPVSNTEGKLSIHRKV